MHVCKVSDIMAIMGLQDIWVGTAVSAYKTCGHAAIVRLQCRTRTIDHSLGTTTM
jgi:hypothetical protein